MRNTLDKIIDVTYGMGSSTSYLILGDNKTALIDCGMAYCASGLINNIKKVLKRERGLDYIFLSHSHYDHIGAIPCIRQVWPNVKVLAAEYAKNVLLKHNALKTIKDLSNQAGRFYGMNEPIDYNDDLMKVDQVVSEGDALSLGGLAVTVLETPGHTRCSLSFLINNEVVFASETTGVMAKSGKVHPCFIISYEDAIKSINKCRDANPSSIISPHYGLISKTDTPDYWEKCIHAAEDRRTYVLELLNKGYEEDRIFEEYKRAFQDKEVEFIQPGNAFEMNNRAMIRTIISGK